MTTERTTSIHRRAALKALAGATVLGAAAVPVDADRDRRHRLASLGNSQACDFGAVVEETMDSVVTVRVFDQHDREFVLGSGWVYDRDGDAVDIVTNWHVVFRAVGADVRFGDGEWRPASQLRGEDRYSDLAVVRVDDAPEIADPLTVAEDFPAQGDPVAALGAPIGLERTITTGVVSAVDRSTTVSFEYFAYNVPSTIQIDAATNPGNSGGPLVDCDGDVVGVNFAGTPPAVAENVNFAVSTTMVDRIVPELIENGSFEHPYVGMHAITLSPLMSRLNDVDERTQGVYVDVTVDGYPADGVLSGTTSVDRETGIPIGGDVIVAIDDETVGDADGLRNYLFAETRPSETVTFTVIRDGEEESVEVELEVRPTELERVDVREPTL